MTFIKHGCYIYLTYNAEKESCHLLILNIRLALKTCFFSTLESSNRGDSTKLQKHVFKIQK